MGQANAVVVVLRGFARLGVTEEHPEPLDALFAVLADPTRRALLQQLVRHGPDTATRLVDQFPVTRQAVVKHLQAMVEAGLVTAERSGREVYYRATPEQLADAIAWLLDTSVKWDRRLERLRQRALKG
ncbi:MAG: transcriptional regulator, ArsR family [Acidimicrobiia bacterium]|nr:transcriptional regulator, ArsR family [Acidimicrobiia bacterium]